MPRRGENIYKRKDGRWEGRYIKSRSPVGKAQYGYVYAKTYQEVKTKLGNASIPQFLSTEPGSVANKKELFESVAMAWFQSKKTQVKETTSNKYFNLLHSYILPDLGQVCTISITTELLENHCNYLLSTGGKNRNGLSPKTVSDVLSVIRSILQFVVQKGMVISCDANLIHVKQQVSEMRVLSRNEQEELYHYLYTELTPGNIGILISLFTGLRVGEVCALRWEDISFPEQAIYVHQTMQRVQVKNDPNQKTKIIITAPKSACSIRTIPIPDLLVPVLELYKTTAIGYVLTNSHQRIMEPRTLQNYFKKALRNSSIKDANFHSLRHTFATRCIELGFDVKTLSEILGHAGVNITMNRYVHPSMELKKENMQRLSLLYAVK